MNKCKVFTLLLLVVVTSALSGCSSSSASAVNRAAFSARPSHTGKQSMAAVKRSFEDRKKAQEDYRVGPGDLLEVSIFEWELRGETHTARFRVAESGIISLPVVGDIQVGGETVAEIRKHIENTLRKGGYIKSPRVTVNVVEFRSKKVAVVGAVNSPGVYVLQENVTTLLQVLSLAGGTTEESGQVAYITLGRKSEKRQVTSKQKEKKEAKGKKEVKGERRAVYDLTSGKLPDEKKNKKGEDDVVSLDLYSLMEKGNMNLNMVLQDGDTVYVPKAKSVSVLGYVERPGSFALTKPTRVLDAIAMANGILEDEASPGACILKRQLQEEEGTKIVEVDLTAIANGDAPNIYLHPYDVIVVRRTAAKRIWQGIYDFTRYIFNFSYNLNN